MFRVVNKYRVIATAETGMRVTVHRIFSTTPFVSGITAADIFGSVLKFYALPELLIELQR